MLLFLFVKNKKAFLFSFFLVPFLSLSVTWNKMVSDNYYCVLWIILECWKETNCLFVFSTFLDYFDNHIHLLMFLCVCVSLGDADV